MTLKHIHTDHYIFFFSYNFSWAADFFFFLYIPYSSKYAPVRVWLELTYTYTLSGCGAAGVAGRGVKGAGDGTHDWPQ